MSFGKECSFSSSSGAASRVFHFKINTFPTLYLPNPQLHNFKSRRERDLKEDECGECRRRSCVMSVICVISQLAREVDINRPHVFFIAVSSSCRLRSSSPSQKKSCLSRRCSLWGWTFSEFYEHCKQNSQDD